MSLLILNQIVFILILWTDDSQSEKTVIVDLPSNGLVKGVQVASSEDRDVLAFLGIPFAKPPIGNLRFKHPEPVEPHSGIYDATKAKPGCLQLDLFYTEDVKASAKDTTEDCLHLNVFAPRRTLNDSVSDAENLLPVFVFLYGGAFIWGENQFVLYNGVEFAADANAIFVVPNYRLNIFGFLKSAHHNIHGNMGLWDQYMALKWIKKNIRVFGGDPDEITLGGQSAGAFSAGILSYSKLTMGLFKRMWLMSGTPLSMKFLSSPDDELYSKVSEVLGCENNENVDDEMNCLQHTNITQQTLKQIEQSLSYKWPTFGPRPGDDLFEYPVGEFRRSSIHVENIVLGVTEREGDLIAKAFGGLIQIIEDLLYEAPESTMRLVMRVAFGVGSQDSARIYKEYTKSCGELSPDSLSRVSSDIVSDVIFDCPASIFADHALNRHGKVRQYVYAHQPSIKFYKNTGSEPTHNDDIPFFLGSINSLNRTNELLGIKVPTFFHSMQQGYSNEEHKFSRVIVKLISNFMRKGEIRLPESNTDWPLYTKKDPKIVYLAPSNFTIFTGPKSSKCSLWEPYIINKFDSHNEERKNLDDEQDDGDEEIDVLKRRKTVAEFSSSSKFSIPRGFVKTMTFFHFVYLFSTSRV